MCKIIIIPNASKIKDISKLSIAMSYALSDQSDGYGFAALGEKGVFGSRTLAPNSFKNSAELPEYVVNPREDFGEVSKVVGGAMFHGRISTNNVSLLNTHPIELDSNFIIHNGVVTNHGEKYPQKTSNDTEHVLHHFLNGGIHSIASNLTGYYACGIIDNKGMMHIFRDDIAPLKFAFSNKLDSPVFATNETLIEKIGKFLGEKLTVFGVKSNVYLVFSPKGELLHKEFFTSRGYDTYSQGLKWKSLGEGFEWEKDMPSTNEYYSSNTESSNHLFDVDDVTDEFLDELDFIDGSYIITDNQGMEVRLEEFLDMSLREQASCTIKRSDGTYLVCLKMGA